MGPQWPSGGSGNSVVDSYEREQDAQDKESESYCSDCGNDPCSCDDEYEMSRDKE